MVNLWILNVLAKEVADSVEYVKESVELWKESEDHDQTNGAKLYQIENEVNVRTQGCLITSYYTKMKKLWEELNTLSAKTQDSCWYTCGSKENMHKAEQDKSLTQFLMGFNRCIY